MVHIYAMSVVQRPLPQKLGHLMVVSTLRARVTGPDEVRTVSKQCQTRQDFTDQAQLSSYFSLNVLSNSLI